MSDITVNFTKENGNIVLESIIQDNEQTFYASNTPLLTVDEDGKMNKVEGVDLNKILNEITKSPRIDNDDNQIYFQNDDNNFENIFDFQNDDNNQIYFQNDENVNKIKKEEAIKVVLEAKILSNDSKKEAEDALDTVQNTNLVKSEKAKQTAEEAIAKANNAIELANNAETAIKTANTDIEIKNAEDQAIDAQETAREAIKLATQVQAEAEAKAEQNSQSEINKVEKKIDGGKKNKTKKSIKAGKKKSRKVRFIMTKKSRQNKKNRTRR